MTGDTALLLLCMGVSLLVVILTYKSRIMRSSSRMPPGTMGWPIVGDYLSFMKPHPINTLGEFMETRISKFGKIFSTNQFGNMIIVSADAELNKLLLQNDMKQFQHGRPAHILELADESALLFATGDDHKHLRSISLNFVNNKKLQSYLADAEEFAIMQTSSWKNGSIICTKDEAMKFTFGIIVKNTLGMAWGSSENEELREQYEALTKGLLCLPIKLPGTTYHKALKAKSNVTKVIMQKVDEKMQIKGADNQSEQDSSLWWLVNNTLFTREHITEILRNFIIAGSTSSSGALPTCIYFLARCPKALQHLRKEHLEIVQNQREKGEARLTWEDYKRMEFTQCVINEALRLGSGDGIFPRKACTDVQFKGFTFPRGCTILVHAAAMHLDPSLFEDPGTFNPWRWLGPSGMKNIKNFLPFGGGAHRCLGAEVARLEMAVFLHHLLIRYDWKLVNPELPMATPGIEFSQGLPIVLQQVELPSEMKDP